MMINRWLSGVVFLSLLSFFSAAFAAEPSAKPSDVRIIIDISGSMKETDPDNLRIPALNLLVELLPDQSQSGVWTFGRYVNMLVPLGLVDQAWRDAAKAQGQAINSVGLRTNLTDALARASWKIAADSGFSHSVILLTDGKIDMAEAGQDAGVINAAEKNRLFRDVLPVYAAAGARIHTLALSEGADKELLQQISLETGGLFLQASDADELLKAFLKAFDRAVPVEQVPMENNRFDIDASVKEFTALIFRKGGGKETRLIQPDGTVIAYQEVQQQASVRWHQDVNFDLITVQSPEAGSWIADADLDPDNRVQILSDLTLAVDGLPVSLFSGNPIDLAIALKNAGSVVTEDAILRLTDISLKVTAPDGRSGSKLLSDPEKLPPDGIFREALTRLSQVGEYRFEINAVGRTFQRRQVLSSTLMEPLRVEVNPLPAEQRVEIRVIPEGADVDSALSRVIAKISSPDESSIIQSMEFNAERQAWLLDLRADKGPGNYDVVLNIRGVSNGGATFKSKPDDIRIEFPLPDPDAPAATEHQEDDTVAATAVSVNEEVAAAAESNADTAPPAVTEPAGADEKAAEETSAEPVPVAEPVKPDLAKRFAEQAAEAEEPAADEEGVAWWVYALLAMGNLVIFGGAGYWWFMKRRQKNDTSATAEHKTLPDDLPNTDLHDDDFGGDFDAFDGESEEEIPLPAATPSSMGGDADINVAMDDDFDIDPEEDKAADDDWGEFDTRDDPDKPA
ncbi:MAG: VWA domain-containing protein [Saccharospirillaceae bacterium]|nr:VWA domain-containing protein [Saccharospirillaceae bacterium]MCD8532018.1 VWA domain-containing protein [Saccharospirillaceae bacterium]